MKKDDAAIDDEAIDDYNYKPINGIVCLIDALGAKNFSDSDNINFLKSRKVIRRAIKEKCSDQIEARDIEDPKVAIFNDTIVIAIEITASEGSEYNSIKAMGIIVRKLISDGISKGIFFRGAIGTGNYFIDLPNDTIIGQAVTDAANWYESTEFIGCILSPRLGFILNKYRVSDKSPPTHIFVDSKIQTKDGEREMICVNWPKALLVSSIRPEGCIKDKELSYLYEKFGNNLIPQKTEMKYYNTLIFFNECKELSET